MSSIYDALRRIQGQKDSRSFSLPEQRGPENGRPRRKTVVAALVCVAVCVVTLALALKVAGVWNDADPAEAKPAGSRQAPGDGQVPAVKPAGPKSGGGSTAGAVPGTREREGTPVLENLDDYLGQGERYYQDGEYDKALAVYTQAMQYFKNDARLLNNVGTVMLARGQSAKAVIYLRRSASLSGETVEPVYNLACAYARLGDVDESISHLKTACAMNPEARDWAARDPDLSVLRGVGDFDRIVGGK